MFVVRSPQSLETPVLFEVPHAGVLVPDRDREQTWVRDEEVLRDSDLFMDRAIQGVEKEGATALVARISRYVVDLNRAPDDIDQATVSGHPSPRNSPTRGVIWRLTADGRPVLKEPLRFEEYQRRLRDYYVPYHRMLRELLEAKRERFGHAILVAAHSMPSRGAGDMARADVVPGTRGQTTAPRALIATVENLCDRHGLSWKHDDPYRGGYTTLHYGVPEEGISAIQIEINRGLYADEDTAQPFEERLVFLQRFFGQMARELGKFERSQLGFSEG